MKTLLLAAVVLAAVHVIQAAQKRSVSKRLAKEGVSVAALASQMNLGDRCGFKEGEKAKTSKGHDRQRLHQTYGGLEVVGATADGEVVAQGLMTGSLVGTLAYSLENDIPDTDACPRQTGELMQAARQYMQENHQLSINEATPPKYVQVFRKIYFEEDEGVARLVYQLDFLLELQPTPCRPFFVIDACDLNVRVYFDRIHNMTAGLRPVRMAHVQQPVDEECDTTPSPATTAAPTGACPASAPAQGEGGNQKRGRIVYGQEQPYCLLTQVSGGQCTMSSKYARVIDLEQGTSDSGKTPVEFNCAQGYSDAVNGGYGVANDAFYYGNSNGKMYEDWYGFYALGYAPKLRVHYRQCYDNAFWNGRDMTFGDGCSVFHPLVSQDVVAHELGHGITSRASNLEYRRQSGGINEAFSDMCGEIAELFSTNTNDWLVGADIFKRSGAALRYFDRPSRDGRSLDSADEYTDGVDVHYSSGVFNRAFYQLVTVQNLPLRQAFEIFLQANRVIWGSTTGFQEGACGAMKAAYDLGYDVNKVKNAFSVVAIDLTSCDYQSFQQSVSSGETRSEVMVSSLRNPVFALDVPAGNTVVIDAFSEASVQATVSVTSDAAGTDVLYSGPTPFVFDTTAATAYFKLSNAEANDVEFDITVEAVS